MSNQTQSTNIQKENTSEASLIFNITGSGVAEITLNRPDIRNAFDDQLIGALTSAFTKAESDASVSVILLSSVGRHFSAGADLNWMRSMVEASYDENLVDAQKLARLMSTINDCCKPVVTKVRGAAFGGAVGLASCCETLANRSSNGRALYTKYLL